MQESSVPSTTNIAHDEIDPALLERGIKLIAKHFEIEEHEVKMDASFVGDMGADSLSMVELSMAFEDEFGVDLPERELVDLTVGSALARLSKILREKADA